jgi:hypothetical protein
MSDVDNEDNYIEEEFIFEDDQEEALLIAAVYQHENGDYAFWEALREYFEPNFGFLRCRRQQL